MSWTFIIFLTHVSLEGVAGLSGPGRVSSSNSVG